MKFRDTKLIGKSFKDQHDRLQLEIAKTGELFIYNQAASDPYKSKNIILHYHHILDIFKRKNEIPSSLLYLVDRGSDNEWEDSVMNFIYYGKIWSEMKMDIFVITGHAPGNDEFNPIERLWSPVGNMVAGLTFSDKLDGELLNPKQRYGKSSKSEEEKEKMNSDLAKVFDIRNREICSFWDGKIHDSFKINAIPVEAKKDWNEGVLDEYKWDDFIDNMNNKSFKNYIKELELLNYFIDHCSKRDGYYLMFMKCQRDDCFRCRSYGADRSDIVKTIRETFSSKIPDISLLLKGHCPTYLETLESPDKYIYHNNSSLCCQKHDYFYSSNADRQRHLKFSHQGEIFPTTTFICKFKDQEGNICGLSFASLSILSKHKETKEHIKRRKKKAQDDLIDESKKKKKARVSFEGTIIDYFYKPDACYYCGRIEEQKGKKLVIYFYNDKTIIPNVKVEEVTICHHTVKEREKSHDKL